MSLSYTHFTEKWIYLWPPYFLSCGCFLLLSSPNLSGRRLDVYHTSTQGVALVRIYHACLKCAARGSLEMQDAKKLPKIRHLDTIAQLCRAISSQLRHVSTIGKNCYTTIYPLHGPAIWRTTSGWDLLASLGNPCKFQRVSRLGSVATRHSSSRRQPNFAALNRGRHLYSAGRSLRWASAHILVCFVMRPRSTSRGRNINTLLLLLLFSRYYYLFTKMKMGHVTVNCPTEWNPSCVWQFSLRLICKPNLKGLASPVPEIGQGPKN